MNGILGHWTLGEGVLLPPDFEDNPPLGFIYRITDTLLQKDYIGKKQITRMEKKPPLKGKVRRRTVIKQTDWKTYTSSCNQINRAIETRGKDDFKFEILQFVDTKWELAYFELYHQMRENVMFREDSYNGIINVRLSKFDKFIKKYAPCQTFPLNTIDGKNH